MKQSLILLLVFLCFLDCKKNDQTEIPYPVTWQMQESGVNASLRGLHAVSDNVAWASGAGGTVLRTVDGGRLWQNVSIPNAENFDFRDVHALDDTTAWVLAIGRPAKIYQTTDGGQNWTEQYHNDSPGIFLDAFDFWDNQTGIAVGDPIDGKFVIIKTHDAGQTWHQVPPTNIPPALDSEAFFAASGTCLIAHRQAEVFLCTGGGPTARVFRSINAGNTFSTADTPILAGNSSTGTFSVAFYDESHGIVVGGDYQNDQNNQNNAALTKDGGATWIPVPPPNQPAGFRSCVTYVPNTSGYFLVAVGTSGSDYSTDRGSSWTPISTDSFHAVSFAPDGAGYASGANGQIAKCLINMK
ncbi:MAG: oxidoreductase [Planctomycetes bacterium]|nr:oxidoreductase [Planctomycetota bacterium]